MSSDSPAPPTWNALVAVAKNGAKIATAEGVYGR
jgi:hypothetical protein